MSSSSSSSDSPRPAKKVVKKVVKKKEESSSGSSESEDDKPQKVQAKGEVKTQENEAKVEDAEKYAMDEDEDEEAQTAKNWKAKKLIEDEDTGIEISVSEPSQKGGGLSKKYMVYKITGHDEKGPFEAQRRYNEFKELRAKLTENWPGIFIPPLPEKKTMGNLAKDFIEERTSLLNKFMQRCAKLPHIFYSPEFQILLRTSKDSVAKVLAGLERERPANMLKKYEKYFENYLDDTGEKTEASVTKYFTNLDKTINFFNDYRTVAKKLASQKRDYKLVYLKFMHYTVIDYKNKLKDAARDNLKSMHDDFVEEERKDELQVFLQNIKELLAELSAFDSIKKDITYIRKQYDKMRDLQTKYNNELSKIRSMEGTMIKSGMFKKVPKAEKIKELEKLIEEATDDLNALTKLRYIIYNLLNFQEFPRLIDVKRRAFAQGITAFGRLRLEALGHESKLLESIENHYKTYIEE